MTESVNVNPRKWRELCSLYERTYREKPFERPIPSKTLGEQREAERPEIEKLDNTILSEQDKIDLLRLADDELFKQLDRDAKQLAHTQYTIATEFSLKEKIWNFIFPDLKLFNDIESLRSFPLVSEWWSRLIMVAVWEKCNERRDYYMPDPKLLGASRAVIDDVYYHLTCGSISPTARKFAEELGWSIRQFENIRPRLQLKFITEREARKLVEKELEEHRRQLKGEAPWIDSCGG